MPVVRRARSAFFLAVVTVSLFATTGLKSSSSPDPEFADSLWVAESGGAIRVSTDSGATVVRITGVPDVRAVAVDSRGGVVWLLSQGTLYVYDFTGARVRTVPVRSASATNDEVPNDTGDDEFCQSQSLLALGANEFWPSGHVAINPTDGSAWASLGGKLYHVSAQGAILSTHSTSNLIRSVRFDERHALAWVATCRQLFAYDGSGTVTKTLGVGDAETWVRQMDYDANLDQIWIALGSRVERYDQSLTRTLNHPLDKASTVQSDGGGKAWVGAGSDLVLLDASGTHIVSVKPLPGLLGSQDVLYLAANRRDRSVWAASTGAVSRVNAAGQITHNASLTALGGDLLSRVNDLALYTDLIPPDLSFTGPAEGSYQNSNRPTISFSSADVGQGVSPDTLQISVNGTPIAVTCAHSDTGAQCNPNAALSDGYKTFRASVADYAGNQSSEVTRSFTIDTVAPAVPVAGLVAASPALNGYATVDGAAGSVEAGTTVVVTNTRTGQAVTVMAAANGSFSARIAAANGDVLTIKAQDIAGNVGASTSKSVGQLPPDPSVPVLSETGLTSFADAAAFLYRGSDAVQIGVPSGAIGAVTAAVLKGRVLDRSNNPISGVTITVKDHPEYGYTVSRSGGVFDMVVNGGGALVLSYRKDGYVEVQRQVDVPWLDYALAPDVVMVPWDSRVTTVALGSTAFQVARGTTQTDADGTRTAAVIFTPGTTAQLRMADGSTQPLTSMNVRATEFTVGANGPAAMPGDLPPTSAYTYAAEFSADEAVSAGAVSVEFNQPVVFYQENFLNFPVGQAVPIGAYDREKETWVGAQNGRVVKILSISGGMVDLDIDGSGTAASAAALAGLGISDGERQQMAALYTAGQTLWRARFAHFTPWDCNWPRGPAADATEPKLPPPTGGGAGSDNQNKSDKQCGSVIECQNQSLGESVPIVGTPFALHYRSDRVPGRTAAYTLKVPLTNASYPASLKRVEVAIKVAGRRFSASYAPAPDLTHAFTWDGKDAYGRTLNGEQIATVDVGHVYDAVYYAPADFAQSFARFGTTPITGSRARSEVTLHQKSQHTVGIFDARAQGFGGWTLSAHHSYDPVGLTVYYGDGTMQNGRTAYNVASAIASVDPINDVAVDRNGQVYVSSSSRIVRIGQGGVIETFAGGGTQTADGVAATSARILGVKEIDFGPDGSLYYTDSTADKIRRIASDGRVYTVAGTGTGGYSGDGGPATAAQIDAVWYLDVGSDGTVYFSDFVNDVIRAVTPDGIIQTIAGTGTRGYSGDGGPARLAMIAHPTGVAVASGGSIYFADRDNYRIRKITPTGIVSTIAGTGGVNTNGDNGNGGPATQAAVTIPSDLELGKDGSLYFTQNYAWSHRVRRISPTGIISRYAITGQLNSSYSGDGGPANLIKLPHALSIGFDANDVLYIGESLTEVVVRVGPPLPGFSASSVSVPSADGSELYEFAPMGQHLRTWDARTRAVLYTFEYDAQGRLTAVIDGRGDRTTVERGANDEVQAVVAPDGQRTSLVVTNGYLSSISNPASETHSFTYYGGGLLQGFTNPRNYASNFTYDAGGKLATDVNAANGSWTVARTDAVDGYTATMTSAEGRPRTYQVARTTTGDTQRRNTNPAGLTSETLFNSDGTEQVTVPDGTVTKTTQAGDPRFKMLAPIPATITVTLPSGKVATVNRTRAVTLSNSTDPLSLLSLTETVSLNGKTSQSVFDATTRTYSNTSATGRTSSLVIDALGRPTNARSTGLAATAYAYDPRGRLQTITEGSGSDIRTTGLSYNSSGYLDSVTDALGRAASLTYDAAGRVKTQTLPGPRTITYNYDANGNLTLLTPPGRPAHAFIHTAVDLEEKYTPPAATGTGNNFTQYAYNRDKQLATITRPDGQVVTMTYGATSGRLDKITLPAGAPNAGDYVFAYHTTKGTLSTLTAPGGQQLSYTYDGFLPTAETLSGTVAGTVNYGYDNNLRLTSLGVNGTNVAYGYDDDGLLTQAGDVALARHPDHGLLTGTTLGNLTTSVGYNTFGELQSDSASYSGNGLYQATYTRDKLGRITDKSEIIGGVTTNEHYDYKSAGQLAAVTRNGTLIASYDYDANGNRTSGGAAYDDQDRLLSYGSIGYTYTGNGELKTRTESGQTQTFNYDALSNLISVQAGSTTIDYVVDGRNRRVGKKVNGSLVQGFLYQDQLKPVTELNGANQVVSRFVYGSKSNVPDYIVKNGTTYRIVSDHLGSPRLVINVTDGSIAQRMDFDVWGDVMLDTNPGFQPFGFAGGLYDRDTKLVRFGARDYDAKTGRWTAKDPIRFRGGDTNLFGYTFNDPINLIDPSGLAVGDWWDYSANTGRAKQIAAEVLRDPRFQGLNDPSDAARHAEWSRRMAEEIGPEWSAAIGIGHELWDNAYQDQYQQGKPIKAGEILMDLKNNFTGINAATPNACSASSAPPPGLITRPY